VEEWQCHGPLKIGNRTLKRGKVILSYVRSSIYLSGSEDGPSNVAGSLVSPPFIFMFIFCFYFFVFVDKEIAKSSGSAEELKN
jgi:hypothetical protein